MMSFTHAHEYPVVTDDTRMPHNKPIYLAFNLRTDNRHRFGIESKQAAKLFLLCLHNIRSIYFISNACAAGKPP